MPTKSGIVKSTPAGVSGAGGGVVSGAGATAWGLGVGVGVDGVATVDDGAASVDDAVSFASPSTAAAITPIARNAPRTTTHGFLYQGGFGGTGHPGGG
jgi:hypothetical protein